METWEEEQKRQNNSGLSLIRTANECIEEAEGQPDLKPLFGTLWQMGELTFLAGDTGKGKTILSVSIADAISKGLIELLNQPVESQAKVLYYDFELNDRQFRKRYSDYKFSDEFYRVVINPSYLGFNKFSIETIQNDVEATGATVIIIDNITALALKSTQNQDEALNLMRDLKSLALQGLSVLVLSHTPKVAEGSKLTINHLAGSKHLSNFADSVFFIVQSRENPDYRYLKQVKCRNAEQLNEVIVCELLNEDGRLFFNFVKYDNEDSHIIIPNTMAGIEITEEMEAAYALHKEGKSLRAIAAELGVGKSTIDRWIKNRPMSQESKEVEMGQLNQANGTMGQVKSTPWTDGTGGQTESMSGGTEKKGQQVNQRRDNCLLNKKIVAEKKTEGTAGQIRANGTPGQTKIKEVALNEESIKEIVPGENKNGTAGQRVSKPILVTNKKGQQFMLYHHELLNQMGINFEDIEPEPHEILNQVEIKKTKPVYTEWQKDGIAKVNNELKKWIMLLIRLSKKEIVNISDLKELLERISKYKESFYYRHLPKDYEYADFIESFKSKINKGIVSARIESQREFPLELDNYEEELKEILFQIG